MSDKPVIGASSCLIGNPVRFDGGHKRHSFVADTLAELMKIKTICPEMGMGLTTPRPAIRLQNVNGDTRLVMSRDHETDLTDQMNEYAQAVLDRFENLDGFIFKKGSPSCGAWRVPVVVHHEGHRRHDGTGLFAQAFMQRFPWIPVEEEGRLNDAKLRTNFIERVYALRRWHNIDDPDTNLNAFVEFHARHKLMLMARSQVGYQKLGQWVANTTHKNLKQRRQYYINEFMNVMKTPMTQGKHVNVLMHIMGYLKKKLSSAEKQELLNHFESYRNNRLPLVTLLVLLQHHLQDHPTGYIHKQYYLMPCPSELSLNTYAV